MQMLNFFLYSIIILNDFSPMIITKSPESDSRILGAFTRRKKKEDD